MVADIDAAQARQRRVETEYRNGVEVVGLRELDYVRQILEDPAMVVRYGKERYSATERMLPGMETMVVGIMGLWEPLVYGMEMLAATKLGIFRRRGTPKEPGHERR